jgi:hypothetical protein
MPYIPRAVRAELVHGAVSPASPGELNFVISNAVKRYLDDLGISYRHLNDVLGVLTCVQHEVYRRLAAPYEDRACEENGDVF